LQKKHDFLRPPVSGASRFLLRPSDDFPAKLSS
jgi:hypothetical protein